MEIPYSPRTFQREIGQLCRTKRFGVIVCHRRFGKTVLGVNINQQTATMCQLPRPRVAYIGPTYTQGKAVAWDYMQHYARPIPGVAFNQAELRVDYPNGGQARIFGADNPDSLRGIYLDRAVMDEFGMHPAKTFSEVINPTLVDRGGSALFCGTPNGKNQFYEIAQFAQVEEAKGNPEWFFRSYPASKTGLLDVGYLTQARAVMTDDEYQQEFECSFEASVKGAIYAKEMANLRSKGQICRVPYDPSIPVDTDWDLGIDAMAIWFSQTLRSGEEHLIDYYENIGGGMPEAIKAIKEKPYIYGDHWAPHDIEQREISSGLTRKQMAANMGIQFKVTPKLSVDEGITAAQLILPRCWFDSENCRHGLDALTSYRRDYNVRLNEFKATPVHDWASHGADAFRGKSVRSKPYEAERQRRKVHERHHDWMAV